MKEDDSFLLLIEEIEENEKEKKFDEIKIIFLVLGGVKCSWKLIKCSVNEIVMEKNIEKIKLNWDMLVYYVKGLMDLECVR